MNRRNFLAILVASIGGLLLPGKKSVAGRTGLAVSSVEVSLCRCHIAGFQYHQGPGMLTRIKAGQPLCLEQEPDNPHDPLAIAVRTREGRKLGYLPRRLNEIPAGLMDSGQRLSAVVIAVDRDAPPWEMVEMEVVMGRLKNI